MLIFMDRTYSELNDLRLDCPNAPYILNGFVTRAKEGRIMSAETQFV